MSLTLNAADYAVIGVILVSAAISVLRGFVKEILSLGAWLLAAWVAVEFSANGSSLLDNIIASPTVRVGVSFVVLFVITLFLASMVNFMVSQFIKRTGLSGTDRAVGLLFGTARGAVIVSIVVLLAGVFGLTKETWWRDSTLLGYFEHMAYWMRDNLPPDIAANITYN